MPGRFLRSVATLLAVGVVLAGCASRTAPSDGTHVGAQTMVDAGAAIARFEAFAGSQSTGPMTVDYVALTSTAAGEHAMSPDESSNATDTTGYLFNAQGSFLATGAKHPPGSATPSGSVLSAVTDTDGRIRSWSVGSTVPRTASLGPLTRVS